MGWDGSTRDLHINLIVNRISFNLGRKLYLNFMYSHLLQVFSKYEELLCDHLIITNLTNKLLFLK